MPVSRKRKKVRSAARRTGRPARTEKQTFAVWTIGPDHGVFDEEDIIEAVGSDTDDNESVGLLRLWRQIVETRIFDRGHGATEESISEGFAAMYASEKNRRIRSCCDVDKADDGSPITMYEFHDNGFPLFLNVPTSDYLKAKEWFHRWSVRRFLEETPGSEDEDAEIAIRIGWKAPVTQ